ncbi:MAG: hypothetical protein R2795_20030 [Saprospiraceae bacterium]
MISMRCLIPMATWMLLSIASGQPGLGALYPDNSPVLPPLTQQALLLPDSERYSYVFDGNAQLIDHCLTTH